MPDCYKQFMDLAMKLEKHFRDMQDMEFTIEEGKLYFLQTRNGKRTSSNGVSISEVTFELLDSSTVNGYLDWLVSEKGCSASVSYTHLIMGVQKTI